MDNSYKTALESFNRVWQRVNGGKSTAQALAGAGLVLMPGKNRPQKGQRFHAAGK